MIYFLALIPATALCVAGYFVLYLSSRSAGGFQKFGRYLGFWAFTLAGLLILGAIFAAAHVGGMHRHMHDMHDMHDHMYGPWHGEHADCDDRSGPRAEATPPAPPAAPAAH